MLCYYTVLSTSLLVNNYCAMSVQSPWSDKTDKSYWVTAIWVSDMCLTHVHHCNFMLHLLLILQLLDYCQRKWNSNLTYVVHSCRQRLLCGSITLLVLLLFMPVTTGQHPYMHLVPASSIPIYHFLLLPLLQSFFQSIVHCVYQISDIWYNFGEFEVGDSILSTLAPHIKRNKHPFSPFTNST